MQIIRVNLGRPERLEHGSYAGRTGTFKRPVPVAVGELGLEGDAVLNTSHHGGPDSIAASSPPVGSPMANPSRRSRRRGRR